MSRDPILIWRPAGAVERWFVACRLCKRESLASAESPEAAAANAHAHVLQAHVTDPHDLRQES